LQEDYWPENHQQEAACSFNPLFIREKLQDQSIEAIQRRQEGSFNPLFIREKLQEYQDETILEVLYCIVSIPYSSGKNCKFDVQNYNKLRQCCFNPLFIREKLQVSSIRRRKCFSKSRFNPLFIREKLQENVMITITGNGELELFQSLIHQGKIAS